MERVHRCPERTTCRVPTNGAIFYGIAPKAMAYVQDFVGPDTALQTNTALTNILISNNSWGYGNNDYDIFAASYDAAVRDSLPGRTGEYQVAYVFAAGRSKCPTWQSMEVPCWVQAVVP